MISTKKLIKTDKGDIVLAGEGVSGTLVVAEGGEFDDREAEKLGIKGLIDGSSDKPVLAEAPGKPWEASQGEKPAAPAALPLSGGNIEPKDTGLPQTFGSANRPQ